MDVRAGRAVAGVAMIGLAAVIWTGASPMSLGSPWSTEEQRDELAAGVTAVRVEVGSGDVLIRTGDRERTSVTADVRDWRWDSDEPVYHRDGDTLVLTGCDGCSVDYTIVVPRGSAVTGETGSGDVVLQGIRSADLETGSGEISVREVTGAVAVRSGSGGVTLSRVTGPVDVESSSGSVLGSGLAGPVLAATSSGDVELELTRAQDVRASTSSGDVHLTVPDGRYRVDSDGGSGGVDDEGDRIEVVDDPDARHVLELSTSSGQIEVSAR